MPRYIDADALQLQLQKKKSGAANGRYTDGFNDALLRFKSMVHSAKTIDVVPVVRGEWIVIGMRPAGTRDTHYCSVCESHGRKEMNFCHNCGADMRRESEVKE